MTRLEKLFIKILHAPKELRFEELQRVLMQLGYLASSGKGSHMVFRHQTYPVVVVPRRSPVKRVYIEQVREVLRRHLSGQKEV